jgi:F-type H+-transporting ATPase subunit b
VTFLQTFAETANTGKSSDIFTALGIDWRLLVLQIVAFLILVWLLGKFVYPKLMKSVDQRQADIEAAAKAAKSAQESASESQEETARLLDEAKKQAAEIMATAKIEATDFVNTAEAKARATAEKIVADAHAQLQKDVEAAKRDLHNETLALIALTTEKVVRKTHTKKDDEALIAELLKEAS